MRPDVLLRTRLALAWSGVRVDWRQFGASSANPLATARAHLSALTGHGNRGCGLCPHLSLTA